MPPTTVAPDPDATIVLISNYQGNSEQLCKSLLQRHNTHTYTTFIVIHEGFREDKTTDQTTARATFIMTSFQGFGAQN